MSRRLRIVALVLVSLFLAGIYIYIEDILPYSSMKPVRKTENIRPDQAGFQYDSLEIQTSDNLKLKGYVLKADKPMGTIILLHGISDCKEHFYGFARSLAELHFNAVLIDLRAHGKSEGEFCTFGYFEKDDIKRLTDYLRLQHVKEPIGIFGNSLGGAIALQAMGIDHNLKFGIIESTFDRLENIAEQYGKISLGFKNKTLSDHVIAKSGKIAGFNPFEVNPVESCRHITCPVFMSHGDADDNIPFLFGQRNFNALASIDKQFETLHGVGHENLQNAAGQAYMKKMKDFLLLQVDY